MLPRHESWDLTDTASTVNTSSMTDATGINVICTWPVSDEYGTGSRVLYYVLVATCIFARNVAWLREACLAGALLLPTVAGVHGIVIAANHVDGAVDMDIYGVFQFCAIGVLAAPVTVRLSRTYSQHRGRNIIFVWAIFVVAGLLSIIVEFLRASPTFCTQDDNGNPISSDPRNFPYAEATCGVLCGNDGPFSILRTGTANNIYLIPSPTVLSFHTAMLLSAGCCITAVIMLLAMSIKNPEPRNGLFTRNVRVTAHGKQSLRDLIMKRFASVRRSPEVLPLYAASLAIVIIGEQNMWSSQVSYQRESFATIGQWSPIAATSFAIMGSVYLLLAEAVSLEKEADSEKEPGSPVLEPMQQRLNRKDKGHLLRLPAKAIVHVSKRIEALNPRSTNEDFHLGDAGRFPTTPGEEWKNVALVRTQESYDRFRPRTSTITSVNSLRLEETVSGGTSPTGRHGLRRDTISDLRSVSPMRRATLDGSNTINRTTTLDTIPHNDREDDFLVPTRSPTSPRIVISPSPDLSEQDQITEISRSSADSTKT